MPRFMTDDDFQAESDVDALVRANEVQSNPKRMARAKRRAVERAREAQEAAETVAPQPATAEGMLQEGFRRVKP